MGERHHAVGNRHARGQGPADAGSRRDGPAASGAGLARYPSGAAGACARRGQHPPARRVARRPGRPADRCDGSPPGGNLGHGGRGLVGVRPARACESHTGAVSGCAPSRGREALRRDVPDVDRLKTPRAPARTGRPGLGPGPVMPPASAFSPLQARAAPLAATGFQARRSRLRPRWRARRSGPCPPAPVGAHRRHCVPMPSRSASAGPADIATPASRPPPHCPARPCRRRAPPLGRLLRVPGSGVTLLVTPCRFRAPAPLPKRRAAAPGVTNCQAPARAAADNRLARLLQGRRRPRSPILFVEGVCR